VHEVEIRGMEPAVRESTDLAESWIVLLQTRPNPRPACRVSKGDLVQVAAEDGDGVLEEFAVAGLGRDDRLQAGLCRLDA
jgi:hypothetical protein